jgi:hypothetical protein
MSAPALLDQAVAERLAKLLGLFGSHHDGEVLAAARKAHALIRQLDMTWHDLIAAAPATSDWRTIANACRAQAHRLSAKEFNFVANMVLSRRAPSAKQAAWLHDIYERVSL